MSVPYEFAPSTVAKSGEVNANFEVLSHSGMIVAWPSNSIPTGWLLCDGQAVSRTTYADLFAAIGTTFGAGDGSTTFNVPNIKGRVIVGKDGSQTEFDTLGETGGAKTHTLTTAEIPSHTHIQDAHTHTQNSHTHPVGPVAWGTGAGGTNRRYETGGGGLIGTEPYNGNTGGATATNQNTTATNQYTGGGGAHNNLQPYIVLNYLIKT